MLDEIKEKRTNISVSVNIDAEKAASLTKPRHIVEYEPRWYGRLLIRAADALYGAAYFRARRNYREAPGLAELMDRMSTDTRYFI